MLKSELLELIKDIENESEIDEIITSKGFAKPLNFGNKVVATENDLKSLIDSERDKGIEGFKKGGMQKIIEAEILKRTNKEETPVEKELREMKAEFESMKKEKARAEMVAKYKDTLADKKIPSKLIDFVLGEDEETTNANISLFEDSMKSYIDSQVSERLNGGYVPPKEDFNISKSTYEQLLQKDDLSLEEAMKAFE
ncbi:DUF4355 domain-containing protein [Clostridium perfringens]|uniref:DUF4355 domain-containing protein n=1 Tax=Clostridium perfringens TaxID=1502 RepID=UPI001786E449|nr:DUF4355 domain-containing protein [Clostridium perfringens]